MSQTRLAILAATLLVTGWDCAADSPTVSANAVRRMDAAVSAESSQAGFTSLAARIADTAGQPVVIDSGLGILERHLLLRSGIAY